jgi:hypothetical protein
MKQSIFKAGYNAGVSADYPVSAYQLSSFTEEYRLGYVVGLAFMESVRRASSYAGSVEAASLGRKYGIPYEALEPYFDDSTDPDVLNYLRSGYDLDDEEES